MTRPKMSALVASAIRNLRELRGSTSKEIMSYIKSQYNTSDSTIQKQIYTALKRGLDYGILKRDHGYYSLNTDPDMLYKADGPAPLEQGRRRRRRRRRRGRGRKASRGRGGRGGRGRGRAARGRAGRGKGRGRGRRRRRRRGSRRAGSRASPSRTRSLAVRCRCSSRKGNEETLRKTPVENLRKDMTYLYKKGADKTSARHSRSRDRSQTRSRSVSSEKEMVDERDQL